MGDFISKNRLKEIIVSNPQLKDRETQKQFVQKLVERGNEIEGYNASFNAFDAVENIPASAKELANSFVHLFTTNPLTTIKGISSVGLGLLEKAVPGVQNHEQAFDAVADAMVERYGSKDKLLNTVEKDPVGFAADLSSVLTGGAGLARGAASAGTKAALLSTKAATRLSNTAKVLSRVGNAIDPVAGTVKVVANTVVPANLIKKANDAVGLGRLMRNTDVDATMREALGITKEQAFNLSGKNTANKIGERLAKWGVTGTLDEISSQLGEIANKSKKTLDDGLAAIGDKFQNKNVEKVLDSLYKLRKPSVYTADEFKAVRDKIVKYQVKLENEGLTLSEMNDIKRMSDNIAKIFKESGDLKSSTMAENLGALRKQLKENIESEASKKGFKEVAALNEQNQFANGVKKVVDKNIIGSAGRGQQAMSLAKAAVTELASTGIGYAIGGPVGAIAGAVLGGIGTQRPFFQVVRNPRFQSDLATAIQLLKDKDFQKLAGGVKFNRQTTGLQRGLKKVQRAVEINEGARQVLNKVLNDLKKTYPTLSRLRLASKTAQAVEENEEQEE